MKGTARFLERDLVLVGGGHAHVGVLRMIAMARRRGAWKPDTSTRITLIAKEVLTPYSGMLPGYVAGHYTHEQCHIDLVPLARLAGATLIHAAAVSIDLGRRTVHIRRPHESDEESPPIDYDVLSINVGITPDTKSVPGAAEHTTAVKPIDRFVDRFDGLLRGGAKSRERLRDSTIAIVGGGAGGVELCLALHHRLSTVDGIEGIQFVLYTRSEVLSGQNGYGKRAIRKALRDRKVRLVEGAIVLEVFEKKIRYETAEGGAIEEPFDTCLWCTNASPSHWLKETGLKTDERGFLLVDETLRSVSHPNVFAAGDCCAVLGHPRPKAGVFAVRQGQPLMENITRTLSGKSSLKAHIPQSKYLSLISLGNKYAVGLRGSWGFQGQWAWKLKDWIDTTWMAQYTGQVREALASMAGDESASTAAKGGGDGLGGGGTMARRMFCAGCGSKVGPDTLSTVLSSLRESKYSGVTAMLEDADDAAIFKISSESGTLVHSVDFFPSFLDDPFVFGAISANHALSDVYAMGIHPKSALAIAVVPRGSPDKVRGCLLQMLSGACKTLMEADCQLSGGHSAQGSEMALGFAVVGEATGEGREILLRKSGLREGQELVLTKGLGTGILLAAEMRGMCRGEWLDRGIESMLALNKSTIDIAIDHGATACTDVTGFGLLGHLREMAIASKVSVEVDLGAVPLLPGAAELSDLGVRSSLYEENLKLSDAVENIDQASGHPAYPLLFDPQTSGGLLFGVPSDRAEACVAKLNAVGLGAAKCIGRVVSTPSQSASGRPIQLKYQ